MKQLVCEMCNSNDLLKDGDYFICQHCGCKYTVEAAKKMMIEGTVDVSGSSVKIDSSNQVENLRTLGDRAAKAENYVKASEYYDKALELNPHDAYLIWNAAYIKVKSGRDFHNAMFKLGECLVGLFEVYKKEAANNNDLYAKTIEIQKIITPMIETRIDNDFASTRIAMNMANHFAIAVDANYSDIQDDRFVEMIVGAWKYVIDVFYRIDERGNNLGDDQFQPIIKNFVDKVRKYDSTYEPPHLTKQKGAASGCYVATAVYGSYDCPEVWTLRRYRDYDLAKTWYGRLFIKTYYAISPTIVKWFGDTEWFKNMWRGKLDRMVTNLKSRGYEDTPYEDKDWK